MLTLLLVRHGQTDWSKARRFCGRNDPPLNATGRAMADAMAERWGGERWDAVYASPLLRARQTAEPLAARAARPVTVDPDWVEIDCGRWEGLTQAESSARDPEAWAAFLRDPSRNGPAGGESGEAALVRTLRAWERVRAAHPEGRVAIVAHKGNLRLLACTWLGIPLARFRSHLELPLSGTCLFEVRDAPRLIHWADASHLSPALRAEAFE